MFEESIKVSLIEVSVENFWDKKNVDTTQFLGVEKLMCFKMV